jgi:hypothetical protein
MPDLLLKELDLSEELLLFHLKFQIANCPLELPGFIRIPDRGGNVSLAGLLRDTLCG